MWWLRGKLRAGRLHWRRLLWRWRLHRLGRGSGRSRALAYGGDKWSIVTDKRSVVVGSAIAGKHDGVHLGWAWMGLDITIEE